MARFLPALLVVGLLGGSAAAFAVTERLKLERSPIFSTRVDKFVSPYSGRRAKIIFRLDWTAFWALILAEELLPALVMAR